MRLTSSLQHAKKFFWGKGWGPKERINTDAFYYRMQWNAKRRRPLEVIEQTLPEGVTPIDPNAYLKKDFVDELRAPTKPFVLPWPYSFRPVKGTTCSSVQNNNKHCIYKRQKRLVEPLNLPLYFTNTILENALPTHIDKLRTNVEIDDAFVDFCRRRINWCIHDDSSLRKLPKGREFPYIDQNPPRVWGNTLNRKETSLLHTLYDISNTWMAKKYGFNTEVIRQKVSDPHCILPLNRNNKLTLLDLECDFISVLSPIKDQGQLKLAEFDSNFGQNTSSQVLSSIHPLSWELAFDGRNFYPTDFDFQMPHNSSIQSIYLSNNNVRMLKDDDFQGRSVMFCYGFAAQQAKFQHQANDIEQIVLEKPICISCIYTNPTDFKVGFVLFQLNTLKLDDQNVHNQVWISEPKSVLDNIEEVITDMVTVQSLGIYN